MDPTEVEPAGTGGGFVLRADPSVRVASRAHKMSKSRGNVINPDDVVWQYGADSLRLYEMFMGPLRDTKVWGGRRGPTGAENGSGSGSATMAGPLPLDA